MPPAATGPHPVDEVLPLRRMMPLGIQHVFVMAASPISAVFLVSQTLGLSSALTVNLLSATFILSGLGTVLQSWGPWKFGARLPFVMLPGGAPIVLFLGIAEQYDIRTAVGAVILAAVFYFVALPLFATTARTAPVSTASRVTTSGAPLTTLRVNTAAVSHGNSEKRSPRSRLPTSRTPHPTPAATKPEAAVTPGERDFIPIVESLFIMRAYCRTRV